MKIIKGPKELVDCNWCGACVEIVLIDIQMDHSGMCKYSFFIDCPCCGEMINCKKKYNKLVNIHL